MVSSKQQMDSSPVNTVSLSDGNWYAQHENYETVTDLNAVGDSFTIDPRIPNVVVVCVLLLSPVGVRVSATDALSSRRVCARCVGEHFAQHQRIENGFPPNGLPRDFYGERH